MNHTENTTPHDIKKIGCVYVLESKTAGCVKIGRSARPSQRIRELCTQGNHAGRTWVSPLQFDCVDLESRAHKFFASRRKLGEWFDISLEDAVEHLSTLLSAIPSEDDILAAQIERSRKAAVVVDRVNQMLPKEDKEWTFALRLARIAKQMFVRELFSGSIFNDVHGDLSMFEVFFAILIHNKSPEDAAQLLAECALAANGEDTGDFLYSVESEALVLAKAGKKASE